MSEHFEDKIKIYGQDAIEPMEKAGKLAARVLDFITPYVKVGVSTGELDKMMHEYIIDNGATPAPLNYRGYPKATCISINHVICHGIPDFNRFLKATDMLNIDVTVILDGWYGDTSRMFPVGKTNVKSKKLVDVTYEYKLFLVIIIITLVRVLFFFIVTEQCKICNNYYP